MPENLALFRENTDAILELKELASEWECGLKEFPSIFQFCLGEVRHKFEFWSAFEGCIIAGAVTSEDEHHGQGHLT